MWDHTFCPLTATFHLISKRWVLLILRAIHLEHTHFSDIRRSINGLSARVLSERLGELVIAGFISKHIDEDRPTFPSYSLTRKGIEFMQSLGELNTWVERHGSDMMAQVRA